jgi:glycosyltransferase
MKISIITVVYNNVSTLETAIKSVIEQSYQNLEYIIIDGGSTDGTIELIRKYDSHISYWSSERDEGLYDAMNKGIKKATGDVIGILNSDDMYQDNQVLSDVMKSFTAMQEMDILYGDLVYVKADDTDTIVRTWKSTPYFNNYFEFGNVPPHPALFLRAQVYQSAGLFNLDYKLAADYEFMLRIFKKYDFTSNYLNRLMVRMRLGGETNKSFKNIVNGNREILNAWRNQGLVAPVYLMPLRFFKRILQFF